MAAGHHTRVNQAFGSAVRRFRVSQGLTQEALAERAELHRTYISDIERGARNVSLVNIARIARALSISLADLMSEVQATLERADREQG